MPLRDHFPFKDITPYKHQLQVFEAVEAARASGAPGKFILLRGPTGCGKSAIAVTMALEAVANGKRAHILASHRFLQSQYLNDYEKFGLRNLWGKRNYPCQTANMKNVRLSHPTRVPNCGECLAYRPDLKPKACKESGKAFIARYCSVEKIGDLCLYEQAKVKAADSQISLTNYNSFLAHTFYAQTFDTRQLLIVDEAHLLADRLAGFLTTEIPLLDTWVQGSPKSTSVKDHLTWLNNTVLKAVNDDLESTQQAVSSTSATPQEMFESLIAGNPHLSELQAGLPGPKDSLEEEFVKLYMLADKIKRLLESSANNPNYWVVEVAEKRMPGVSGLVKVLEYKPVKVGKLAEIYLFKYGLEVVLMSATMNTGPFLADLGLSAEDIKVFIDLPSVFPLSSRPIINNPVGSMAMANRDATMPKIAAYIETLLTSTHAGEKGVIHLHSFKNGKELHDLLSPAARDRVIWHMESVTTRVEDLTEKFFASPDKWLASPAVVEGLDGKDDRIRAQVLLKAPYPYLGSAQVAARKRLPDGEAWFTAQAANSIVQAYGRGTRHAGDYSVLYVLDSEVNKVVLRASKLVPAWFMYAWAQSSPANWKLVNGRWSYANKPSGLRTT